MSIFFSPNKKKSKGFTLVEVILVVIIGSIVMASVVGLLFAFLISHEQDVDFTTARQRGQMVFTILTKPVLGSGLGAPNDTSSFQSVFDDDEDLVSAWDGPLVISPDISGESSRDLYLVYAEPVGIGVEEETDFTSGTDCDIPVSEHATDKVDVGDWVSFPSSGTSFKVTKYENGTQPTLTVTNYDTSGTVPLFDELHRTRAVRMYVENGVFKADNVFDSGQLGEVSGIGDMFYEWDDDSRVLTAYVLARGQSRKDELVTPSTMDEWPDAAEPISDENRHYRLSVFRSSWRVRN